MRWMLEVAYIGILSSWRWLLGSAAVVGALVGLLLAVGVLGGGSDGSGAALPSAIASPTPAPAASANPTAVPQPTPTIAPTLAPTLAPAVAPAPKSISVPILATRANNVGSLEFVLVYDSAKLELEQVERGLLSGDALIDFSTPSPGRLWTGIIDLSGIDGSGPVAVVRFKIRDNVGGNMPFTLENVAAFDANTLVDIITGTTPGEFTVSGVTPLSPIVTFQ
ncbi:MAG: cohesin domain-containing protein [Chloroflexota bacterium]|uniref:Cohesin domain-containing protein n=1 Tax=marine metagenome TaxID=408172 RepID=A0A381Q2E1_9ZZZZ|nr:cohesin domain-containing protein [Chloroflexota bacterium]